MSQKTSQISSLLDALYTSVYLYEADEQCLNWAKASETLQIDAHA
ncbi:MAG TPA: hypothetical protein VFB12_25985 [Ktedonobacteraceae bacterium]|nr:hypothetical protein [Ktedonobacteraceae bacterium]